MQIDHAQEQCHHQGCTCTVANDHRYCSDQCRAAEEGEPSRAADAPCPCGHAECHPSAQAA